MQFIGLFAVIVLCIAAGPLAAESPSSMLASSQVPAVPGERREKPMAPSGPYCGVYSLYAALRLSGQKVQLDDLISPEYVGSVDGSSMEELRKAAADFHMHTVPLGNVSTDALRACKYPAILHVSLPSVDWAYDHWVLFLGNDHGMAMIFDPPQPPVPTTYGDLASRWDGSALVLSSGPIDLSEMRRVELIDIGLCAGAVLSVIIAIRLCWGSRAKSAKGLPSTGVWTMSTLRQSAGLLVVAVILGGIFQYTSPAGFWRHRANVRSIIIAHFADFLPRLGVRAVAKAVDTKAVIIDARFPESFRAGHIRGSVNIPPDSDAREYERVMHGVPPDAPVMVYCQSSQCPFASKVARRLAEKGYANLSLFPGGWVEWAQSGESHGR